MSNKNENKQKDGEVRPFDALVIGTEGSEDRREDTMRRIDYLYHRLKMAENTFKNLDRIEEEKDDLSLSHPMGRPILIDRRYIKDDFFEQRREELKKEIIELSDKINKIEACL